VNNLPNGFATFFLLVVVVLVGIGGFLYFSLQKGLIKTIPIRESSPTPTNDETTNWTTYINNDYGFHFSYPTYLKVNRDDKEELYYDNLAEMLSGPEKISVQAINNIDV